MTALVRFLFALALFTSRLAAQDAAPSIVVRTSFAPVSGAVIGQHVAFYVDVMFREAMPRPPQVTLPDVPGVQAFRFETQGTTMLDTIAGTHYVGQRFEFALYARRGGDFVIPSPVVTLLDQKGAAAGKTQGQPTLLTVTVPVGVDSSAPVVATKQLTLDEQWTPATGGTLMVGDAIVRTLTQSADDVPGFVLRGPPQASPAGVRIYVATPDARDVMDRGTVTGRRVDRITYVFERGGRFELPAVVQTWWDLASGTLKSATAPAITVLVKAAAAPDAETGIRQWTPQSFAWTGLGVAGLIALGLMSRPVLRRLRVRRNDPERLAFTALRDACKGTDARAIYRDFNSWSSYLSSQERQLAIREAALLRSALFAANPSAWTLDKSSRFLAGLEALRQSAPAPDQPGALPPLNPAGPVPFSSPQFLSAAHRLRQLPLFARI